MKIKYASFNIIRTQVGSDFFRYFEFDRITQTREL